jgi:nitroreductase
MEVFEAVKSLLAVRSYQDEPVPDSVIEEVLESARLTASSMNRQDWDFVVTRDPERLKQLGELAQTGSYIAGSAFAVAVLVGDYPSAGADAGRVAQDMMLTAWDKGVGSNWVGNVGGDQIRQFLAVPEDRTVKVILPFGYPTEDIGEGIKDRKPISEVVHTDRYGQAYPAEGG